MSISPSLEPPRGIETQPAGAAAGVPGASELCHRAPGLFVTKALLAPGLVCGVLLAVALSSWGQDSVTISKSRLEELERKEAELERLKHAATNAPAENAPMPNTQPAAVAKLPASAVVEPVVTRVSPPASSLPPLKEGEIVDSLDLANQYRGDVVSADKRYAGQKLTVRGEIVGFEKPMFRRDYKILLPGPDRTTLVVCDLVPPEKFKAVFTTEHGTQLVGDFNGNREPIAKVGQAILVHGRCRGWRSSSVSIIAESFEFVR